VYLEKLQNLGAVPILGPL